eukprot:TRINITY_DN2873_c0_g1_i10.p1 TRINITY_DN2873_c0_g1~~TRINITY_DN2873_c0_g1_i10.p1  ORF type:complete len:169 (+),score=21.85 TRINITY_DN2873_c0_g1_i10:221-727(+)
MKMPPHTNWIEHDSIPCLGIAASFSEISRPNKAPSARANNVLSACTVSTAKCAVVSAIGLICVRSPRAQVVFAFHAPRASLILLSPTRLANTLEACCFSSDTRVPRSATLEWTHLLRVNLLLIDPQGSAGTHPRTSRFKSVSYTHLRAHETPEHLVCRLLLEKKKKKK